jgi:hypothetical protein
VTTPTPQVAATAAFLQHPNTHLVLCDAAKNISSMCSNNNRPLLVCHTHCMLCAPLPLGLGSRLCPLWRQISCFGHRILQKVHQLIRCHVCFTARWVLKCPSSGQQQQQQQQHTRGIVGVGVGIDTKKGHLPTITIKKEKDSAAAAEPVLCDDAYR